MKLFNKRVERLDITIPARAFARGELSGCAGLLDLLAMIIVRHGRLAPATVTLCTAPRL
jgi:hypothetical protein